MPNNELNTNPQNTNPKKKKIIITLVFIMILILIIFLTLILTNTIKLNNNEQNNSIPPTNPTEERNDEDSEYTEWMNYLLISNIQEITITKFKSPELGDPEEINQTITLTPMNLKDIFNILNDYTLTKVYSMGRGGITNYQLTISYIKDNKNYKFEIINNSIIIENIDESLLNILNNSNYNIVNEELENIEGSFYYFEFDNNYTTSIYDNYF